MPQPDDPYAAETMIATTRRRRMDTADGGRNGKDSGTSMLNESEFAQRATETLVRIEAALLDCGADLDVEQIGDGVMEVEFADGSKMVLNRHQVAREIWLAARSGGFHFRWDGQNWVDTRSGEALLVALSRLISAQAGRAISLE
jgi:CyaY protein